MMTTTSFDPTGTCRGQGLPLVAPAALVHVETFAHNYVRSVDVVQARRCRCCLCAPLRRLAPHRAWGAPSRELQRLDGTACACAGPLIAPARPAYMHGERSTKKPNPGPYAWRAPETAPTCAPNRLCMNRPLGGLHHADPCCDGSEICCFCAAARGCCTAVCRTAARSCDWRPLLNNVCLRTRHVAYGGWAAAPAACCGSHGISLYSLTFAANSVAKRGLLAC